MPDTDQTPPPAIDPDAIGIDPSVPHSARIYDFHLGGINNFDADRQAGQAILDRVPEAILTAKEHRGFLQRAVRFMAGQGIRQFIDIGTGLPTQGNVHEVTQEVAPNSRVVYVDKDHYKPGCVHTLESR
jgi:S-adenosyl methyltransferase